MLFVCYPKCTTCQKAEKYLKEKGAEYTVRHIKEDKPTLEELAAWYKLSGLPLKRFFNTSGVLYKELQLKDKLPTMSEEEQLQLLATDGMLVKRPLVVTEAFVLAGFKEKEWQAKGL
ncbi:MAG: arsenate reductase family protein [Phascolarctobacterium sp.]|nr:arsenate reductase family protein [Phascolarctobacterium sp.]